MLRKDGTCRWIEFRTVPIEYEGKRAIFGNLLDITPRKELEIEILRSNRELSAIDGIMEKWLLTTEIWTRSWLTHCQHHRGHRGC